MSDLPLTINTIKSLTGFVRVWQRKQVRSRTATRILKTMFKAGQMNRFSIVDLLRIDIQYIDGR